MKKENNITNETLKEIFNELCNNMEKEYKSHIADKLEETIEDSMQQLEEQLESQLETSMAFHTDIKGASRDPHTGEYVVQVSVGGKDGCATGTARTPYKVHLSHVCGLHGFAESGDKCPRCELDRQAADDAREKIEAGKKLDARREIIKRNMPQGDRPLEL